MNDQGANTTGDTKADAPAFVFDFFIAHASPDKEHARRFADRLEPDFRVFLDTEDVPLGVDWGNVIDEAQRQSHFTLALISDKTEAAPYAMDEIRAAIDRERHSGGRQRLIPLYINGLPATADDYVYGLRTRQGLSLKSPPSSRTQCNAFVNSWRHRAQRQRARFPRRSLHPATQPRHRQRRSHLPQPPRLPRRH